MFFATVLFTALSTVTASPSFHRRGLPGAVYTCTEANFMGDCQWTAPTNQCRQPGPMSLGMGIQSLGPDPDTACILYEQFDCTGTQVQTIQFPGVASGMPDFQSFQCAPDSTAGNQTQPTPTTPVAPAKVVDPMADPRLAGGVGSLERKEHLDEINEMEKDRFKDGLVGLKKGVYY